VTRRQTGATRVVLVDDHELVAQSLAVALRLEGLDAEQADLGSRDALLASLLDEPPALVLLDLDIGGAVGDGLQLVRPLTDRGIRVLVLSATRDAEKVGCALERGAIAVLDKSVPFPTLLGAVLAAANGEPVHADHERQSMLSRCRQLRESRHAALEPFERLSEREGQVLAALADGMSVGRIAEQWVVSEATVRSQVRGVLVKLGVSSQLEAVAAAARAGWPAT
jgi:DNA-binding NarL/FixJ family response regulator